MLLASLFLLFVAGTQAYQCPALADYTSSETMLRHAIECNYARPSRTSTVSCRYNSWGRLQAPSSMAGCPTSIIDAACADAFSAFADGAPGEATIVEVVDGDSKSEQVPFGLFKPVADVPPGTLCTYTFVTTAQSGSCTYRDTKGALDRGSVPGRPCPIAAVKELAKIHVETPLQKLIRERQYKYPQPPRP